MIQPTAQQQALLDQIQQLYEQLKATSPQHYTLQQWFGLDDFGYLDS